MKNKILAMAFAAAALFIAPLSLASCSLDGDSSETTDDTGSNTPSNGTTPGNQGGQTGDSNPTDDQDTLEEGPASNADPTAYGVKMSTNLLELEDEELEQVVTSIASSMGINSDDIFSFINDSKSNMGSGNDNAVSLGDLVSWAALKDAPEGALPGIFTISATGERARFAKGNLLKRKGSEWQFENKQYDYTRNNNGRFLSSQYKSSYTKDLGQFSWDGGNGEFFANDDSVMGSEWNCLSYEELDYILRGRTNAADKWGYATIEPEEPVKSGYSFQSFGLLLLPDQWQLPPECNFAAGKNNTYSVLAWVLMEANGAVFLPFKLSNSSSRDIDISYHTSKKNFENRALPVRCQNNSVFVDIWVDSNEHSVRMIRREESEHQHTYSSAWSFDATSHWREPSCGHTGLTPADKANHSYGQGGKCVICGYDKNGLNNALPGRFSINSKGDKVQFSKGNLYWDGSSFGFEENQYYLREKSGSVTGQFFWTKDVEKSYAEDYVNDNRRSIYETFFANNKEVVGEEWVCLDKEDWEYLFDFRDGAEDKRGGVVVTVNGEKYPGYCILPDDWTLPIGCLFKPWSLCNAGYFGMSLTYENHYDEETWKKMEAAGAVLFPCKIGSNQNLTQSSYRTSSLAPRDHWRYSSEKEPGGSWYFVWYDDSNTDLTFYESCVDCAEKYRVRLTVKN